MKFTSRDWIWFAICAVAVFSAISSSIQRARLESQIHDLKLFTITVQTLDQQSGKPTEDITANTKPTVQAGQIMKFWSTGGGFGEITQQYIGTPPFAGRISVSSSGYEQKAVAFDSSTNRLVVRLARKP